MPRSSIRDNARASIRLQLCIMVMMGGVSDEEIDHFAGQTGIDLANTFNFTIKNSVDEDTPQAQFDVPI